MVPLSKRGQIEVVRNQSGRTRFQGPITAIARVVMCVSRGFGEDIPDVGVMSVMLDDSIIQDVADEKARELEGNGMHARKNAPAN